MNDMRQCIETVLLELKAACMQCPKTDDGIHQLMSRYDMLFVGKGINTIYSIELRHMLATKQQINISQANLNTMIPEICRKLHMMCEPLFPADELSKGIQDPSHANYQITLY